MHCQQLPNRGAMHRFLAPAPGLRHIASPLEHNNTIAAGAGSETRTRDSRVDGGELGGSGAEQALSHPARLQAQGVPPQAADGRGGGVDVPEEVVAPLAQLQHTGRSALQPKSELLGCRVFLGAPSQAAPCCESPEAADEARTGGLLLGVWLPAAMWQAWCCVLHAALGSALRGQL